MPQQLTFSRARLLVALALSGGLAVLCNLLIARTGVGAGAPNEVVPQGWAWVDRIVGSVWVVLLTALGGAWWLLRRVGGREAASTSRLVLVLAVICLLYPFSFGLTLTSGLAGNILIAVFAAWISFRARSSSIPAALLVLPVVAWLAVATIYASLLIAANSG